MIISSLTFLVVETTKQQMYVDLSQIQHLLSFFLASHHDHHELLIKTFFYHSTTIFVSFNDTIYKSVNTITT